MSPADEPFSPAERTAIRAELPHLEGRAYLNYASVGPMPLRAREGAVRLSPHFPTERSDIEQLVHSLHEFA